MSNATKEKLSALHGKLADVFTEIITNGVPIKDEETGAVHKAPPSPAYLTQIRQFLKDNNIEAVVVPGSPLANLTDSLPFAGSEHEGMH